MSETIKQQTLPILRFPEFREAWEEKRLGDIAEFTKGKGIAKADISENGQTECIRYGQLYTDYAEKIDHVISRTNVHPDDLVLSRANDIIIPASGETQIDIATASCVTREGIALGGDLNIIRVVENGVFLSYLLNSKKKLDIARLSQGISVVHLYSTQLKTLKLMVPSQSEQNKITTFLGAVDDKIFQLKQKKLLLEDYKKGCMQKLFSQEIRFDDDGGNEFPDWEEKRIGDALTIGSGKDYKHLNFGSVPVYGTGGLMTYVDDFLFEGESVGIGRKGTIDRPVWLTGKFWTVDTLFYTHSFVDTLPRFIFYVFQRINWKKYNEASGVPSLSKSTLEKIKVEIPSSAEQRKISEFLSHIDSKLELLNEEVFLLNKFKLSLLQQIFV
jgi:type I restriction enzyme S subunit